MLNNGKKETFQEENTFSTDLKKKNKEYLLKTRKKSFKNSTEKVIDLTPNLNRKRKRSLIKRGSNCSWTVEDDRLLTNSVKLHKGKSWKKISVLVPNKTATQCLHRWQKVLDPALVKGPWTEEEDKKVIELVEKFGPEKWSYIASFLPGRIGKQCRERWFNHLSPVVKKSSWSREEEWILWLLHRKMGNKWSIISKELPGRTDNTIKNHWNSTMKKRCKMITIDFEKIVQEKSNENIEKVENEILEQCKIRNEESNKLFFEEKMRHYKLFKNSKTTSRNKEWKNVLNLRTHSKKIKKRGRKSKKNKIINEANKKSIEQELIQDSPGSNISQDEDKENKTPNIKTNTPEKSRVLRYTDSQNLTSADKNSIRKNLFRDLGQRSAFSSKYPNISLNMVTPEKPKELHKEKLIRKIEDPVKTISFLNTQTNIPFTSTNDKTRSNKKGKNCYICRLKPVKIVSAQDIVDIEDPNMLDKIDEKDNDIMKSCFCEAPNQINVCNFCVTNSKEKEKERKNNNNNFFNIYVLDIHSQKKNFEGFTDFTPNKTEQYYCNGTPGYLKFNNNFSDNSDKKMNFANLDRMFFSNIEIDKDVVSPKKENQDNLIN